MKHSTLPGPGGGWQAVDNCGFTRASPLATSGDGFTPLPLVSSCAYPMKQGLIEDDRRCRRLGFYREYTDQ